MPAEKGIPKPKASARRLDVRNYDLREAWGCLPKDERLIMIKEGVAYVDIELVCLKFDEFLKKYKLSIHQLDAGRPLAGCGISVTIKANGHMDDFESLESV